MVGAADTLCSCFSNLGMFLFRAVTCTVNARKVTIKGKRGEVTKDFSHIACELKRMNQSTKKRNGLFIRIRIWFGGAKQACAVNTLKSSIGNMVIGVTEVSASKFTSPRTPSPLLKCVLSGWFSFVAILIINYTWIGRLTCLFISTGLPLQNETCARSFPHQRRYPQGRLRDHCQELPRWQAGQDCQDEGWHHRQAVR